MRLRPPREDDARAIAESCQDPEIARWTRVPSPYTREDAIAWIALANSTRASGSALHLLIAAAQDDRILGAVGIELGTLPVPHGELGYWVAAPARGRGVATRAVRLLSRWAFEALALPRLEIHVMAGNERSRAVARGAGFDYREMRTLSFKGSATEFEVYAVERPNLELEPL